jgi:hypothetical protein
MHIVPSGTVQVPAVAPPLMTQRAGVMQGGPEAVSHDAPSAAAALQLPISPAIAIVPAAV